MGRSIGRFNDDIYEIQGKLWGSGIDKNRLFDFILEMVYWGWFLEDSGAGSLFWCDGELVKFADHALGGMGVRSCWSVERGFLERLVCVNGHQYGRSGLGGVGSFL